MKPLISPEASIKWSKVIVVCGAGQLLISISQLYNGESPISPLIGLICAIGLIGVGIKQMKDTQRGIDNT